jgi:hypothetical protein
MKQSLLFGLTALVTLATGCNNLTHVSEPDILTPNGLKSAQGAELERAGAISTFATAYSNQALYSGLFVDEFSDVSSGHPFSMDQRRPTNQPGGYPYDQLSQARVAALEAIVNVRAYDTNPKPKIAELYALVGYAEAFFVENLCSGVPVGVVESNGVPAYGPTLSRGQLIGLAISHFDSTLIYAGTDSSLVYLAHVGVGRALLDSGDYAGAAAAVTTVPASFSYSATYSTAVSSQLNQVYLAIYGYDEMSVSDSEGENGLPFVSAHDPRVPTDSLGSTSSSGLLVYGPNMYSAAGAPIAVATGTEAGLIQAEASLPAHGGTGSAWLNDLNALRQNAGDTALSNHPLQDPGSDAARSALLFHERAFWLFGTGHRMGDVRRLVRQYGRGSETAYPTGLYEGGPLMYASTYVYQPYFEEANPNFTGCSDTKP